MLNAEKNLVITENLRTFASEIKGYSQDDIKTI